MKVLSVNISQPHIIQWNGREETTGIYKEPVESIRLEPAFVENDTVADPKYHGGIDKACYLYSADYYEYWEKKYPDLDWTYGMFGENITIEGLDENKVKIGDVYKVGEALVQVSQPRQPCYKLGIKFGSQKVLKEFISFAHPGVYVRVIQPGSVKKGDTFELEISPDSLSIVDIFNLLYNKSRDEKMIEKALFDANLAESAKVILARHLNSTFS